MAVAVADHVVSRDDVIWAFGPDLEPVLEVEPGATVTLQTNDCFTGQIQTEDQLVTAIDMTRVNSATGPVTVRGAEPGDSLVVEFLEVRTVDRGVATIIPGFGQLIDEVRSPSTKVFRVDGKTVHMTDRIAFPLRPMVGVIGVATGGEELANAFAGQHGGNLDDHLHGPGTKVYFPVRQPGGMFAVGDMHASMGDGEICGTGVEIAGEVTVRFDVLKDKQARWPVTELADAWVAHGTSSGPLRPKRRSSSSASRATRTSARPAAHRPSARSPASRSQRSPRARARSPSETAAPAAHCGRTRSREIHVVCHGRCRARTSDLLLVRQALSQLS
jgi:amidase